MDVQAVKSARQFEIRKLSAQLWQLKEPSTPAQEEQGRKLKKACGGVSDGAQSAEDAIQRLQDDIEGLKRLPFDSLLHKVRQADPVSCIICTAVCT